MIPSPVSGGFRVSRRAPRFDSRFGWAIRATQPGGERSPRKGFGETCGAGFSENPPTDSAEEPHVEARHPATGAHRWRCRRLGLAQALATSCANPEPRRSGSRLGRPHYSVAFTPVKRAGRLPHCPVRGLLSVHLLYGLHARQVVQDDSLHRRLPRAQHLRHGSNCHRPERQVAGWELHPLKIHAFARRTELFGLFGLAARGKTVAPASRRWFSRSRTVFSNRCFPFHHGLLDVRTNRSAWLIFGQ